MAKKEWRGINDLYFRSPQKTEQKKKTVDLDDEPTPQQRKDDGPEVRLSQPEIAAPSDGFNFNKKCTLKVNVEYLKETSRKRVLFEFFAECDGEKELIESGLEGFEKDGVAEAQAMLYYPEKYKEGDTAEFFFEASHNKGVKKVNSDKVSLPQKAYIRFALEDEDEIPYANTKYQLEIDGKKGEIKESDNEGMVEEDAPVGAKKGTLTFWPDASDNEYTIEWDLDFGLTDSAEEESGVAGRLINLGYDLDPESEEDLKEAVTRFQIDNDIEPANGELDDKTRDAIVSEHGV